MAKAKGKQERPKGDRTVAVNRRARHDYEIIDTFECGIMLRGSEVKSIRGGHVQVQDAYARVDDGEVWLHKMHIQPYEFESKQAPDPERRRKLLLRREEIDRLTGMTTQAGLTLIPLKVYFVHGLAKVELGVARGKRKYDRRHDLAKRDAERDMQRALKARR